MLWFAVLCGGTLINVNKQHIECVYHLYYGRLTLMITRMLPAGINAFLTITKHSVIMVVKLNGGGEQSAPTGKMSLVWVHGSIVLRLLSKVKSQALEVKVPVGKNVNGCHCFSVRPVNDWWPVQGSHCLFIASWGQLLTPSWISSMKRTGGWMNATWLLKFQYNTHVKIKFNWISASLSEKMVKFQHVKSKQW